MVFSGLHAPNNEAGASGQAKMEEVKKKEKAQRKRTNTKSVIIIPARGNGNDNITTQS